MRSAIVASLGCAAALAHGGSGHGAHDHMGPVNPALGTHGYPDCHQPHAFDVNDVAANQLSMRCAQVGAPSTIKIGCVGDSITAGAHSSGPTMTYPAQLQVRHRGAHVLGGGVARVLRPAARAAPAQRAR